jgi:hypothetical protein
MTDEFDLKVEDLTEEKIRDLNPWKDVLPDNCGAEILYNVDETAKYIVREDEGMLAKFNEKHKAKKDKQYVLNLVPYPWVGNPLTAKVIILSQNPGFVENSGRSVPLMIGQTSVADDLVDYFRKSLRLEASGFMPNDIKKNGISARDAFNVMGDWYWKRRFDALQESSSVNIETIYNNFALIQYVPYSSVEFADFPKSYGYLKSQNFTKLLIKYILEHNKDTLFVALRGASLWEKFLHLDNWNSLVKTNRIVLHKKNCYRPQYISEKCLDNAYDIVVSKLKDIQNYKL